MQRLLWVTGFVFVCGICAERGSVRCLNKKWTGIVYVKNDTIITNTRSRSFQLLVLFFWGREL